MCELVIRTVYKPKRIRNGVLQRPMLNTCLGNESSTNSGVINLLLHSHK